MSDYLSPGVYIQELEGPAPIVGVSTSIAGFVGMAERGPVNVPILCTGVGDYTRWFGGQLYPDEFQDIADPNRFHCYLPYAVAGFYANAGQLLYVTRVVPDRAPYASDILYDRGTSATVTYTLMKSTAIGDGTGTTPAGGALITIAPGPPPGPVRLGNGSQSDYPTVTATAPVTDTAAIDQVLQLSHAAGTAYASFARAPLSANSGALTADAAPGQTVIVVSTVDSLASPAFAGLLLELTDSSSGVVSIVVPVSVVAMGGNLYSITLSQGLAAPFAASTTTLAALQSAPASPYTAAGTGNPHSLATDANAGATTISVVSTADLSTLGAFDLVLTSGLTSTVVSASVTASAGTTYTVSISPALPFIFPATGTTVTAVEPALATVFDVAASAGDCVLYVAKASTLVAADLLDIDPLNTSSREVRAIGALSQLSFAQATSFDIPAQSVVVPVTFSGTTSTTLTAAAPAGTQLVALASRTGVAPGSVLLLGTAPQQEYAVVIAVQGARALAGPDPGAVVVAEPLGGSYAGGAPVRITPSTGIAPAANTRATPSALDAPAGSAGMLVTWATHIAAGTIVQITLPDGTVAYTVVSVAPSPVTLEAVTLSSILLQNTFPAGSPIVARNQLITIRALDQGNWGNRLAVSVQDESPGLVASAGVNSLIGPTQLVLATLTGIQPGSYLELFFVGTGATVDPATPLKVAAVNLSTATITLDSPVSLLQSGAIGNTAKTPVALRSREFRLTVNLYRHPDPAVPGRNTQIIQSETYRNLSTDPRHSQYFQTVIGAIDGPRRLSDNRPEGASWLIRTQDVATTTAALQAPRLGPEPLVDILPTGLTRPALLALSGGDDLLAQANDAMYVGADPGDPIERSGIFALLNVPQISIVAVPGQGTPAIQTALIDHCETAQYRFALLDPQYPTSAIADIQAQRQQFDTKFAAIYYPWLIIPDPLPPNLNNVTDFPLPPSGHVAGIYARVDTTRGVFKAPANEVVQGITGLTATLSQGDQDVLNPTPTNINVIRDFRQSSRGIRVWGARIITSDANYTYVPIKRLMIYIEESLVLGLQDVVFEPNAPPLWAEVERLIGNFLTTIWAAGGLQGSTPDQSFFVRCDLTTMTQTDIINGRLIAVVGVAPVYPAEFVIIQVQLTVPSTAN
jgi:phage tail sheath protein FI